MHTFGQSDMCKFRYLVSILMVGKVFIDFMHTVRDSISNLEIVSYGTTFDKSLDAYLLNFLNFWIGTLVF